MGVYVRLCSRFPFNERKETQVGQTELNTKTKAESPNMLSHINEQPTHYTEMKVKSIPYIEKSPKFGSACCKWFSE